MSWFWIVVIGVAIYLYVKGGGGGSSPTSTPSSSSGTDASRTPRTGSSTSGHSPKSATGFRPRSSGSGSSGVTFGSDGGAASAVKLGELVTDFVTGAAFHTAPSTYRCNDCLAHYSPESYDLLRSENGGRCASCRSANLRQLGGHRAQDTRGAARPTAQASAPATATLTNFRGFDGQVVTFTGRVVKVLESRRGGDFAVMFEDKSWKQGFKLVFFKDALRSLGGPAYARGLRGATITVRGLIVNHSQFGYEIIINDRGMVLKVDR